LICAADDERREQVDADLVFERLIAQRDFLREIVLSDDDDGVIFHRRQIILLDGVSV
jgi:hypothetical protein